VESNDEIVFKIKLTAPAEKSTQKTDGLEHGDPVLEKLSLRKSITRLFDPEKLNDDPDTDSLHEKTTDFDGLEPKKSFLGNIVSVFKKRPNTDEEELQENPVFEKSSFAKTDEFDDEFPKPSFLQNLFGRFGKKSDEEDDDVFRNLKIPKITIHSDHERHHS